MSHIFITYSKKDETKLVPSQQWWPTIERNIKSCSALIVIMSPNSNESAWVEREILVAENDRKPIFPLLLAGNAWSRLANVQYADVRGGNDLAPELIDSLSRIVPTYSIFPPPLPDAGKEPLQSRNWLTSTIARVGSLFVRASPILPATVKTESTDEAIFGAFEKLIAPLLKKIDTQSQAIDRVNQHLEKLIAANNERTETSFAKKTEHVTAFMAMPFKGCELLYKALRTIFEDNPYCWEVINAGESFGEPTISRNIKWHMQKAHCFLVEISDGNPNVFYELGLMHGSYEDRPVVLLCRDNVQKKYSDLADVIYIEYPSPDGTKERYDVLVASLRDQFRRDTRLTSIRDTTYKHYLSEALWIELKHHQNVVGPVFEQYRTAEDLLASTVDQILVRCKQLTDRKGAIQDLCYAVQSYYNLK